VKIKDIIKKLEELKEEDYKIYMEVEPIVDCLEQLDGTGYETTTYQYTIKLERNPIVRHYKNINGIKEYLGSDK
jgi:uncharacterized protein (UPF0335 family)